MCRCLEIQINECQNIYIETLIGASKFSQRIPRLSRDMNKMHNEFLLSGIFPRSGIQRELRRKNGWEIKFACL